MAAKTKKKRRAAQGKGPDKRISSDWNQRAGQAAQRLPAGLARPGLAPLLPDLQPRRPTDSTLRDLAFSLAGGAEPRPWWPESHQRIIAAALALTWPSRLVDMETQACQIVGEEFYRQLNSRATGLHPAQWLLTLAEETGVALRSSVAEGTDDGRQLLALLCGLAHMVPRGDRGSETAKLARARFPDIKDPYMTVQAEAGKAAQLLHKRGMAADIERPADGVRAAGSPLLARDAYGSRFLLMAPFSYHAKTPDHWYAWDVDSCWHVAITGAGVFRSPEDALAEWQHAVGPAAGATLSPVTPEATLRLLAPCLDTGPLSDMLRGDEHLELIREFYRMRRRARVLARSVGHKAGNSGAAPSGDDADPAQEAFLDWYSALHDDIPQDLGDTVGTILAEWVSPSDPGERCGCSPHRIEMAAELIRDNYYPDDANAALRLLPEWTRWCIEQTGITGDLAARSRAAALTAAAALAGEQARHRAAERDKVPFRRRE